MISPIKNKNRNHCTAIRSLSGSPVLLAEPGFDRMGSKELRRQPLKTRPLFSFFLADLIVGRPLPDSQPLLGPTHSSLAQIWSWAKFTSLMTCPVLYGCWEGARLSPLSLLKISEGILAV